MISIPLKYSHLVCVPTRCGASGILLQCRQQDHKSHRESFICKGNAARIKQSISFSDIYFFVWHFFFGVWDYTPRPNCRVSLLFCVRRLSSYQTIFSVGQWPLSVHRAGYTANACTSRDHSTGHQFTYMCTGIKFERADLVIKQSGRRAHR